VGLQKGDRASQDRRIGVRKKERDRRTVRENRAPIKRTETGECALIALCMCTGGTCKPQRV